MCGITARCFDKCEHSIIIYEWCSSCPLPMNPLVERGVYKQIFYSRKPDAMAFMKRAPNSGTIKAFNVNAKIATCSNWPASIDGYEKIWRLSETCGFEGGVCAGTSNRILDEYGDDWEFLGRASEEDVRRRGREYMRMKV